ncbi:MAG: DUF6531 domain-containing protein, partial [Actinomycetia bacterium]|nr:DUF6531 domain-containing protein [Actinomycetes bacterium]
MGHQHDDLLLLEFLVKPAMITGTGGAGKGIDLRDVEGEATGNDISGFQYGVYLRTPFFTPKVTANKIHNNHAFGLYCAGPEYIDAADNWWGDTSGPDPYGNCNSVGGYADVQPWVGQTVWYGRVNGHDPHCPARGEPVNMNTGNFYSTHTDLDFEGTGPHIDITRTYNSIDAETDGPLGYGWSYTYSARLETYMPEFVEGDMLLIAAEGDYHRYMDNGDGTYSPEDEDYSTLIHNPDDTWTINRKDGSWEKFDTSGFITEIADENQNTLQVTRDGEGKVLSVTDVCGQTATFAYNPQGRITRVTDPAGRTISYTYDGSGNLTEVTDLNRGKTTYTYDEKHRVLTVSDPKGAEFVHNTYDNNNRVVHQTDSLGNDVDFSYNASRVHSHEFTDALGSKTTFEDDVKLFQIGETDPYGESLSITYDDDGNVTSRTDKLGNTTTMTYDEDGNMLSETDPLGNTTTHTYDDKGNYTSTTDPLGRTTTNVFDGSGNLIQVTNPDGGVNTNVYDSANRKISTTDPEGNTTTFIYDTMGHLLSMTDPEGNTTTYTYDADGNQVTETDPLGNTSQTTYDEMGRVASEIDPLGNATTYTYDASGPSKCPFHKYACIRTSMHPHLLRWAPSRYSRSTARSRALHERRLGAL